MKEMVIPTENGPIIFRPRQVVMCEGAFFMIESVNEVPNGRQVRMYHMTEQEALKYYVPARPMAQMPKTGTVPQNPQINATAGEQPKPGEGFHPIDSFIEPPQNPQIPGAEAVRSDVEQEPGVVPQSKVPNVDLNNKPITGLTQAEIQDGLASGQYTQDSDGNVFKNPNFSDGSPAPNHNVNPAAADQ